MELRKSFLTKKGSFFSTDALIALLVILFVLIVARPLANYVQPDSEIHSDVLVALSNLKVSELEDSSVQSMIATGLIKNPDKSLLEQIGEFYVYNITRARALAAVALRELNTTENIGIWYGNDLIYSTNRTPYENAREVDVARQVISGIEAGQNITGFSARAALSSDYRTNYFYFGGYVGDGNVSVLIDYYGNITNEAEMELVINTTNKQFDFYVNGYSMGNYSTSPSSFEPVYYTFNTGRFSPGFNLLEFRGRNLYIAGGYVKIAYRGDVQFGSKNNTYYFPGINGLINLYDGFFVPQNLSSMDIRLHLNSNYTILLNIGNVTVYNGSTGGEKNITLNNTFLSSVLNYRSLEGRTIPLRLGLENASYLGITQKIDVFSVTDLSGSMAGDKIAGAKNANNILVDFILNTTGNRVGLAGYDTIASYADYHNLSNKSASLKSVINGWVADGYTCICCGIERAIEGFVETRAQTSHKGRLVAYYNFDEAIGGTVADRSGSGNNGAVSGNPTSAAGVGGNSFNLDGTGDYVTVPDIFEGSEGTVSLWIDPDDGTSRTLFDASTSSRDFYTYLDGQRDIRFTYQDSLATTFNGIEWRDSSANIETTGWHNLVFVWKYRGKSPSGELYYDGRLVDSDATLAEDIPDFLGILIGKARTGGSSASDFDGRVDEFRLYTRALNESEIIALNDTTPVCGNGKTEVGEVCDGDKQWCSSGGNDGTKSCNSSCSGFLVCNLNPVCGDGVLENGEECDGGSETSYGCTENCTIQNRFESMIVMSDGQANRGCTGDHSDSVDRQEAINKSIEACEDYGIIVHSVGFGDDADESTLTSIAHNGCGGRYYRSDTTDIEEVYRQIAEEILTEYFEQTISVEGAGINTRLYPDSYIKFNYSELQYPYGLVITAESNFDDARGGSFYIPNGSIPLVTNVISYSGPKWTSDVVVNNRSIFGLDEYGLKYIYLGDPYRATSTDSVVRNGINYANVTTGVSSTNKSQGSTSNKIIFTVAKNASSYSKIVAVADGCIWSVQMEDGSFVNGLRVPATYSGSEQCYYNQTSFINPPGAYGVISNENDAYQLAALNLLRELDLDLDGKSDVVFTSQDLQINLDEFSGIPFAYYTEVEARRWAR